MSSYCTKNHEVDGGSKTCKVIAALSTTCACTLCTSLSSHTRVEMQIADRGSFDSLGEGLVTVAAMLIFSMHALSQRHTFSANAR